MILVRPGGNKGVGVKSAIRISSNVLNLIFPLPPTPSRERRGK
jgi:hypothetical protein